MLRDIEYLYLDKSNQLLLRNTSVLHIRTPLLAQLLVVRIGRDLRLIGGGVRVAIVILAKPVVVEVVVMAQAITAVSWAVTPTTIHSWARRTSGWRDRTNLDSRPLN